MKKCLLIVTGFFLLFDAEAQEFSTNTVITPSCAFSGYIWSDINNNGSYDSGEQGLNNWQVSISGGGTSYTLTTSTDWMGNNGYYQFCVPVPSPTTLTVSLVNQSGWNQTFPTGGGNHIITYTAGTPAPSNINFGVYTSPSCTDCISSFSPSPGRYILQAWVKQDSYQYKSTFLSPQITVDLTDGATIVSSIGPIIAQGEVIDGWQRVEQEFEIPASAVYINLKLSCQTGDCFFDDIRVFPYEGNMKSYVYDPITMRLVAELDERNYATFYEYDEEGKLTRVKKETERGVMTIKESRNNYQKK